MRVIIKQLPMFKGSKRGYQKQKISDLTYSPIRRILLIIVLRSREADMTTDPRLKKLACLLVEYSIEVKEKHKVSITGSTASESLLREIYGEVLMAARKVPDK